MITWKVPQENRKDFVDRASYINVLLMKALAVFAIFAQSFNIIRVLFFSNSGLSTLNNRIYFGLYVFNLACSVAFILYQKIRKDSPKTSYYISLLSASVWLLWNTLLNCYDVYTSGEFHTIMVVTMLIAFSALIIMEPFYALVNIWLNYFVFLYVAHFSLGQGINFTITALLATLISGVRFRQICMELKNDKKMEQMNEKFNSGKFWLTKEQYELISHNVGLITFRLDLRNGSMIFSKNMETIFGKPFEIQDFKSYIKNSTLLLEEDKEKILDCIENINQKVSYQNIEVMIPVKNNEQRWFKVQIVLQDTIENDNMYAIGFMNDITDEKIKIFSLEKNASMDSFTGILNKASINAYGRSRMNDLTGTLQKLAMIIFDMDDFKYINDTFGHPCGDYVLKEVANILKKNAPKGAAVGRLGGDEFIALVEITKDNDEEIRKFAEEVIQKIGGISWEGNNVKARCSAGIAVWKCNESKISYEDLYQRADEALYEAKNNGKNRVFEKFLNNTRK